MRVPLSTDLMAGFIAGTLFGAMGGLALGWRLGRPVQVVEHAAPAQRLDSGATVLARAPDAAIPPSVKAAAAEIGGKLVRAGQIVVKPRPAQAGVGEAGYSAGSDAGDVGSNPTAGNRPASDCSCDPVTVDWGLVRFGDGQRLVVKAEGGEIVGGYDKPLQLDVQPVARKWAALVVVDPGAPRGSFAAIIERDAGPLRLAAAVVKVREDVVPMVGAGWRW